MAMKITRASSFILGYYIALVIFWFSASLFATGNSQLQFSTILSGFKSSVHYGYIFAFSYALIPLFGGIMGLRKSVSWGFFKSSMGKSVFFLSIGLLTWSIGELIWSYYNFFLNAVVPYPSWADASFILSWPLWTVGVLFLGRATGAKFGFKKMGGKLLVIAVPIIIFIISYYFLVTVARGGSITSGGGPLKVFFDIAYPVLDVVILTLAALIYGLSFKYLGGKYKWPVLITLFGFLVNYVADFGFSYTTTINTFYNGCWVDLMFTSAMFVLSFGINSLDIKDA
jgi:hypothetical protein